MKTCLLKQSNFKTSPTHKPASFKRATVVPCASKNYSFNDIIEKRKEIDRQRVSRLKEIGNSIDHIAKAELKSTRDILNEFFPFIKDLKKLYDNNNEKTEEKN
jgi:hypothetical protein